LQRPGQGHEACFFDNEVPLETVLTTEMFIDHIAKTLPLQNRILMVAPNAECVKKTQKFQKGLQRHFPGAEIKMAAFLPQDSSSGPTDTTKLALLGYPQVKGADVIIVDDMVDSAETLSNLAGKLAAAGAKNIYLCASHGLFSGDAMRLIDQSAVSKVQYVPCSCLLWIFLSSNSQVVVSNSLPIPRGATLSSKVSQVSVAPLLAHVISTEHFRSNEVEEFQLEE
jgi:ribose-phosphate pyrophosphokinase